MGILVGRSSISSEPSTHSPPSSVYETWQLPQFSIHGKELFADPLENVVKVLGVYFGLIRAVFVSHSPFPDTLPPFHRRLALPKVP